MFNTVKTIDFCDFEEEVVKRIGENKFSKELGQCLFSDYANDSYNSITIAILKENIFDIKNGYGQSFDDEEEKELYILTLNTIIEIFEEAEIKEEEEVLVCW